MEGITATQMDCYSYSPKPYCAQCLGALTRRQIWERCLPYCQTCYKVWCSHMCADKQSVYTIKRMPVAYTCHTCIKYAPSYEFKFEEEDMDV